MFLARMSQQRHRLNSLMELFCVQPRLQKHTEMLWTCSEQRMGLILSGLPLVDPFSRFVWLSSLPSALKAPGTPPSHATSPRGCDMDGESATGGDQG